MNFNDRNSWLKVIPIAHRGLHTNDSSVPENSMKAFSLAIKAGYAIELDVQPTKDGKIVVFHDSNLKRLCGVNIEISQISSTDLFKYKILNSGESIPLLENVLELVTDKVPLLIELKKSPIAYQKLFYNEIANYKGRIAIQSFYPLLLSWFAKNSPHICRGQLSCSYKEDKINILVKYLLKNLFLNFLSKPNFIAFRISDLPSQRVTKLKLSGMPIIGWTVRTEVEFQNARLLCDNIIFENIKPEIQLK